MFAYCGNNPVVNCDPSGMRYCAATTVGKESSYDRSVSCAFQKSVAQEKSRSIRYNIPLHIQGSTERLCWAYCQVMIEDGLSGTARNPEEVRARIYELAILVNGLECWNQGAYPINCANYVRMNLPEMTSNINSIEELALLLYENGPVYALYESTSATSGAHYRHMVVVTGVDVHSGLVYTNNPWGYIGSQSYEDFKNGFLGMGVTAYTLQGYILINW